MKATIATIARDAGVSVTTVDRVLNGRGGVKARTRDLVLQAAEIQGYVDADPGRPRRLQPMPLDFLLPGGQSSFIRALGGHLEAAALMARIPAEPRIRYFDRTKPADLVAQIMALQGRSKALGVVALDLPEIREAIRQLAHSGTHILNMITELTNVPRIGYVGIDNHAAGRLAGQLMIRFLKDDGKKVGVFAGSLSYRGHQEREMGFRQILAEESRLEIIEMREVRDDVEAMYEEAVALLDRHSDLAGIYAIGGGNRGIARALGEKARAGSVVFIGHELTDYSRKFLIDRVMDAVIDQNPRVEARDAIDLLTHAVKGEPLPPLAPIRVQAVFRENIPSA